MKSDNGQAIIVYGASTSVGFFTTQLAKRAGYFVVGVSGSSAEYAKSAGADVIVDYRGRTPQELVCSILLKFSNRCFLLLGQHTDKETYAYRKML